MLVALWSSDDHEQILPHPILLQLREDDMPFSSKLKNDANSEGKCKSEQIQMICRPRHELYIEEGVADAFLHSSKR